LLAASEAADLGGSALLHLDVRSDNICFFHNHAILVDWNWACTGNPDLDLAFWLPSLEIEGGPLPETLLPAAPEMAAVVSGFFASQAGLTPIPDAPHVRTIQLAQLRSALPWAVRALGLIELVQ
jgi:aminoglycoside phosphotransferase (APT) family kinase protein